MNYLFVGILVGLIVGCVAGWFYGRKTAPISPVENRIEQELRAQIETLRADLAQVSDARRAAETAYAAAEAKVVAADQRAEEVRRTSAEQFLALRGEHDRNLAQMREAFSALSSDALSRMQPQFLELANATLEKQATAAKGDLSERQQAIAGLLKPMETLLKNYQERLAQSETNQSNAIGQVSKHLETLAQQSIALSGETLQLRRVLGSNQTRGRWGEETLRRVVEASGLSTHCDFVEQTQSDDKKPDLLIKMPGDRLIIIDSKVPDLEFLSALNESDDTKRALALKQHADKLKQTIKALADRNYPAQFPNALDYVVLFLPAESLFSAALEGDRELILWAEQRRIMLATPTSLIALLKSVSITWQQNDQAANAREIATAAEELFSRVSVFVRHFEAMRAGLSKANDAYNDAVGSYERSVKPQGERVIKLGVNAAGKQLGDVPLLTGNLRSAPPERETLAAPH